MTRVAAYLLLVVTVALAGVGLVMSHSLASAGGELGSIDAEHRARRAAVDRLRQQVMEAQSLSRIAERAEQLGFESR